jgi:uncharacterized protein YerC
METPEAVLEIAPPPAATASGAVEIEIRLLDRAYAHLRIREPPALARLVASLASEGQHHPVLVVRREARRYVLIDGYGRVEALARLGRDTLTALVLGLSEPEALSYCYRMQAEGRRSALEEGWLVAELVEHDQTPSQIGSVLGRSVSWVSRRLGLARALPDKAAEAVRRGTVSAHGALTSLLSLTRVNRAHCERLCEQLGEGRVSSRQLAALYTAWRAGDASVRERIIESPRLFLKAKEVVTPKVPEGMAGALVHDLEAAGTALLRAGDAAVRAWSIDVAALSSAPVTRALHRCTDAYEALVRHMEEPLAK